MLEKYVVQITQELKLQPRQVVATAVLLEEGATVPFIARYRKEATGMLDEVQIANIRDRLEQLEELDKRRESIIKSLEERKLLSAELAKAVAEAGTLAVLEDLYLPFRKRVASRRLRRLRLWMRPRKFLRWPRLWRGHVISWRNG
jgi:protein Tex